MLNIRIFLAGSNSNFNEHYEKINQFTEIYLIHLDSVRLNDINER